MVNESRLSRLFCFIRESPKLEPRLNACYAPVFSFPLCNLYAVGVWLVCFLNCRMK